MKLSEYQSRATETDRTALNYEHEVQRDVVVSLLGIAGELGTLATTYKKYLRDGSAYNLRTSHIEEEIGDLLWYCATLASKFNISLEVAAEKNLQKTTDRWAKPPSEVSIYDEGFPEGQRLPRRMTVVFSEVSVEGKKKIAMTINGEPVGAALTDNVHVPDGYRFHDAFHLAFATVLGWSPVLRSLMKRKRKDDPGVDENEDGGRAAVIEEAVAAFAFEYGMDNGRLEQTSTVDYEFLKVIKTVTRNVEVKNQTANRWEEAVIEGWKLFRHLTKENGGTVECDLDARTIEIK